MAKPNPKESTAGTPKDALKRILKSAHDAPVMLAFALAKDGTAIVQVDKRKSPRALEKAIKDEAPDSKNHRFGTAEVDPDDPSTVRFLVNKAGGGMASKLTKAIKGSGFTKIKLMLEDGTELESHEEADDTEEEEGDEDAGGAEAEAGASDEDTAEPEAEPEPQAADAKKGEEDGSEDDQRDALTQKLTDLVKGMLGAISDHPEHRQSLMTLATDARAALDGGDLHQAKASVELLEEAINDVNQGATQTPAADQDTTEDSAADEDGEQDEDDEQDEDEDKDDEEDEDADSDDEQDGDAETGDSETASKDDSKAEDPAKQGQSILSALAGAIKQALPLVGANPALGEAIRKITPLVQSAVKDGDLAAARDKLGDLLEQISESAAAAPDAPDGAAAGGETAPKSNGDADAHADHAAKQAPQITKARHVWVATRQKVLADMDKLHTTFGGALAGHEMGADLSKTLREKVDGALGHLDEELSHTLDSVNKAKSPDERAKHIEAAHAAIKRYQAHVSSDATIKMLDDNPFHPVAIAKTVGASLAALVKSIR